jgi:WD40 repeat protein
LELFSVGSDSKVIHWIGSVDKPFDYNSWNKSGEYNSSEKGSINCLTTLFICNTEKYFSIFSSTGKLDVFSYDSQADRYMLIHTIAFNKKLQDAICMTVLNNNYILLLSGGYDSHVNIYTINRQTKEVSFKVLLKGHINDIRDISAICPTLDNTNIVQFASCSQDTYIRLWHITELTETEVNSLTETLRLNALTVFDEYKSHTSYIFHTENNMYYNIILDSVISGHEDAVSSVRYGYIDNKLVLLSSSFDFTVGIWKYNEQYHIWNKDITLGEMLGNKHSFFSAVFADDYKSVIAYTYNGAFYYWKYGNIT